MRSSLALILTLSSLLVGVAPPATALVTLSTVETGTNATNVKIVGNRGYLSDAGLGLLTLDLTDPEVPVLLGTTGMTETFGIDVNGDLVFIAGGNAGLRIVDVTDPALPVEIGLVDTSGSTRGVVVSGDIAYLAEGTDGIRAVDVSVPAAPVHLGAILNTDSWDVTVSDGLVYTAGDATGLRIPGFGAEFVPTPAAAILQGVALLALGMLRRRP